MLRNVTLNLKVGNFLIKPIIATIIMSICSLFIYNVLLGIISQALATLIAIIFAVVIYAISVVALKILSIEEFYMIPYGQKIYKLLEKLGIYR